MTLKVRSPANQLKVPAFIKVRNAANVLKTVSIGKVRDATNALKTFFTTGVAVYINPEFAAGAPASPPPFHIQAGFTAISNIGVPSSYLWELTSDLGSGSVVSGSTSSVATLRAESGALAEFKCTMMIGGTAYVATCALQNTYEGGGGGGGGGGAPP